MAQTWPDRQALCHDFADRIAFPLSCLSRLDKPQDIAPDDLRSPRYHFGEHLKIGQSSTSKTAQWESAPRVGVLPRRDSRVGVRFGELIDSRVQNDREGALCQTIEQLGGLA